MKIYLDNCCFNRPYDDLSSETIKMEAEAKLMIQNLVLHKKLHLIWSFVLSLENNDNLDEMKKADISQWESLSDTYAPANPDIEKHAISLEAAGIKPKDAAHLACAIHSGARFFITTDRKLMRKSKSIVDSMEIVNPIEFIAILEGKNEK
jgi:predicted nucleic acid-binding protein